MVVDGVRGLFHAEAEMLGKLKGLFFNVHVTTAALLTPPPTLVFQMKKLLDCTDFSM